VLLGWVVTWISATCFTVRKGQVNRSRAYIETGDGGVRLLSILSFRAVRLGLQQSFEPGPKLKLFSRMTFCTYLLGAPNDEMNESNPQANISQRVTPRSQEVAKSDTDYGQYSKPMAGYPGGLAPGYPDGTYCG
jgi:hypothetical protein